MSRSSKTNRAGIEKPPGAAGAVAFYTVTQLAIRWGISERQVHRYIDSGELLATRFGRSIRISTIEVTQFEASRTGVTYSRFVSH